MSRFERSARRVALAVWLVGLLFSAFFALRVQDDDSERRARFEADAETALERIESSFDAYAQALVSLRDRLGAQGLTMMTQSDFNDFMSRSELVTRLPGVRGFGMIERVSQDDEAAFVERVRQRGAPDFSVRTLAPHPGDRFVISHLFPSKGNEGALGLDVGSEPNRRSTAIGSAQADEVRLTAPITLVQATGARKRGFLIMLPVYAGSGAAASPGDKPPPLGWVYAPLVVDEVLHGVDLNALIPSVTLRDVAESDPFFTLGERARPGALERTEVVKLHGREWVVRLHANAPADAPSQNDVLWQRFASWAGVATLVALGIYLLYRRRADPGQANDDVSRPTVSSFLLSAHCRWFALVFGVLGVVVLVANYQTAVREHEGEAWQTLRASLAALTDRAARNQNRFAKDVFYLASAPSLRRVADDLRRRGRPDAASGSGRGYADGRAAVAQIFSVFMRANPEVTQARLISLDTGSETVRVNQREGAQWIVPDTQLQSKVGRDYLEANRHLAFGQVFISDLNLNREQGQIAVPHQPVSRFVTPVIASDGTVMALLVINVDETFALAGFESLVPIGIDTMVLNAANDFVLHPDPAMRFASELGRSDPSANALTGGRFQRGTHALQTAELPATDTLPVRYAVAAVVSRPDSLGPNNLLFVLAQPRAVVTAAARAEVFARSGWLLVFAVAGLLGTYLVWLARERDLRYREEQRRTAAVVEHSPDAIIGLSRTGAVVSWNPGASAMFEFASDEVLGRALDTLISPDGDPCIGPEQIDQVLAGAVIESVEAWRHTKYKAMLRVSMTFSPWVDPSGEAGVSVVMRDITEEALAKAELGKLNARLEEQVSRRTAQLSNSLTLQHAVMRTAGYAIITTDNQGTVTDLNAAAEALFGRKAAAVMRQCPLSDLVRFDLDTLTVPGVSGSTLDALLDFARRFPDAPVEGQFVHASGRCGPAQLMISPLAGSEGAIRAYVVSVLDLSETIARETELMRARQEAEEANRAKSAFLANMSHEIRTPLNAVVGFTRLLAETQLDTEQSDLLKKVQVASRSLLTQISDVLDLSKIEARELRLEAEPFDVAEVVDTVQLMFGADARDKGVTLTVEVGGAVPPVIIGDVVRFTQVLQNLVANALKFTREGRVLVSLDAHFDDAGQCWIEGSVSDTGVGISDEAQARLFQPFAQADASTTRKFGGTGLGLSIVRGIMSAMGGQIDVKSVLGEGTEFVFRFPAVVPSSSARERRGEGEARIEVAIAFDQLETLEAVAAQAKQLGWRVRACPGVVALNSLIAARLSHDLPMPDALVIDQHLGGDALPNIMAELAECLGAQRPPALVVAAEAPLEPEALDALPLPTCPLAVSPVSASALFNAVSHGLRAIGGDTDHLLLRTHPLSSVGRWLPDMRVLVVDDSDMNRELLERLLSREGATVTAVDGGRAAIDWLADEHNTADLVLMDIQMPDMDGLEATARIRADHAALKMPIIALSAGALTEQRNEALAVGMDEFLSKPIDPAALVSAIRRCHFRYSGVALPVLGREQTAMPGRNDDDGWPRLPGIDAQGAQVRFSGDVGFYLSSMQKFIASASALAAEVPLTVMDAPAMELMAKRLHKLKGSAGNLGATALAAVIAELESLARQSSAELKAHAVWTPLIDGVGVLERAMSDVSAAFDEVTNPADAGGEDAEPLGDAQCKELKDLLVEHDLEALAYYASVRQGFAVRFGAAQTQRMAEAMDELDFEAAAAILTDTV